MLTTRQQQDLEFLKQKDKWPRFKNDSEGFCCLRKGEDYGFLMTETGYTLFLGNIFEPIKGDGQFRKYTDPLQIIEDGWFVD